MKLMRFVLTGLAVCALAGCNTPTNTKNMFGKQKKNGPQIAGSTRHLVMPAGLTTTKLQTFYPVSGHVAHKQPTVSLVPPGAKLAQYQKKKAK